MPNHTVMLTHLQQVHGARAPIGVQILEGLSVLVGQDGQLGALLKSPKAGLQRAVRARGTFHKHIIEQAHCSTMDADVLSDIVCQTYLSVGVEAPHCHTSSA
eukprot:1160986-Pelagomonas_calceolata.AAC.7